MAFRFPAAGFYTFDTQTGSDADQFLWTDPVATDATLPQAANTARRWCHDTNDTTSSNVGPTSGAGGSPDGYVHPEASSPGAANDEFYMEFDTTLDASLNNIEVQFKTNQRGDSNNSTCVVETNENGAGWVERGSTFGGSGDPDKVATAGAQIWSARSVDLAGLISDASTRIRIKITFPATGTIWHNDYGIDEVVFIGTDQVAKEQEGFRFRNDDGSESAASWAQAQDVNHTVGKEENFRLRVLGNMTGTPPAEAATLEYKEASDGADEWRSVPLP